MSRNPPICDFYYGYPIHYRIENRKTAQTAIASFRAVHNRPKILYECAPIGHRDIQAALASVDSIGQGFWIALPLNIMERILSEAIGLNHPESTARRATMPDLTFGLLLVADRADLLNGTGQLRASATILDEERVLNKLLAKFGCERWQQITPEHCARWLSTLSEHDRTTCKRLLLRFERRQLECGLVETCSWETYSPKGTHRSKKSHKSLVLANIEPTMLTDDQCRLILQKIMNHILSGTVTGIDMAVLLKLCFGLSEDHIAALDLCDICSLSDYSSRYVVRHRTHLIKGTKNYKRHILEDAYACQLLPLPYIGTKCYLALISGKSETALHAPLIPTPKNPQRRLPPQELAKAIDAYLSDLYITPVTDTRTRGKVRPSELLAATGRRELVNAGIEEEELRVLQGLHPQLVSGKYYYDRNNEAALNKIGALLDRWLGRVCPVLTNLQTSSTVLSGKKSQISWITNTPHQRTQVYASINIPPIPADQIPECGVDLELSAPHGISGTIHLKRRLST